MTTLFRSTLEVAANEGRTLSGLAVPWDTPTKVRDNGPAYLEEFAPGSTDVTIRQHPNFPVFVRHKYDEDPVGTVVFSRSDAEGGTVFEAPLSKTQRADDMLELVNDGAMRSVSVGFRPVQTARRMTGMGEVTRRTEVALRELSLAPTGFGQYAEAGVTAVRADGDEDPMALIAAVDAVIDSALRCLDPTDDDYNPAQASDLLTSAEASIDELMDMFGIADPDDEQQAMVEPMRMKVGAGWSILSRRRSVARRVTPSV